MFRRTLQSGKWQLIGMSYKGKGVNLYSASRIIASNALFVANQSRTATATACSLQTQASAASG